MGKENSSTTTNGEHIPYAYSMSTIWEFDHIEDKLTLYREKDCMKKFCTSLREHAKNIIDFEKEKNIAVNKRRIKTTSRCKCYFCEKRILKKLSKSINYWKVRDCCHYTGKYRGAAHSICNLNFNVPNEIPVVFHNGSNHDHHFIIKELANDFEGQFGCLGENTEKNKTFSVPIEKKSQK